MQEKIIFVTHSQVGIVTDQPGFCNTLNISCSIGRSDRITHIINTVLVSLVINTR